MTKFYFSPIKLSFPWILVAFKFISLSLDELLFIINPLEPGLRLFKLFVNFLVSLINYSSSVDLYLFNYFLISWKMLLVSSSTIFFLLLLSTFLFFLIYFRTFLFLIILNNLSTSYLSISSWSLSLSDPPSSKSSYILVFLMSSTNFRNYSIPSIFYYYSWLSSSRGESFKRIYSFFEYIRGLSHTTNF